MKQTHKGKKTSADNAADEMAALFDFADQEAIADRSELTPGVSKNEFTMADFEYIDDGKLSAAQAIAIEQIPALKDGKKDSDENKATTKLVQTKANKGKVVQTGANQGKKDKTNQGKLVQTGAAKLVQTGARIPPDSELFVLVFLNRNQPDNIARRFKKSELSDVSGFEVETITSSLKRLRSKGLVEQFRLAHGNGGGIEYTLTAEGLGILLREDVKQIIDRPNWGKLGQTGAVKLGQTGASIDDDINKSSSGSNDDVPEHIRQVQLSEAHKAGVYLTHKLITETGSHLPTEKIQEMLSYFVFEYRKKGKELCENPIGYFRKALANGDYRKPKGYRSPDTKSATVPTEEPTDASAEDLMKKWEAFCKTEEGQRFKETVGSGALPAWLKSEQAKAKQKSLEKL